jgi:hypothetical protein
MQDLKKLADKLALLEELVKNEEDSTSIQGLMDNPTIGQMYRACRDELPKLLELANSNLNEDLMNRIINITERLMAVKNIVEVPELETPTASTKLELKQSTDEFRTIFDDLPQLSSPHENSQVNLNNPKKCSVKIELKEFKTSNDLLTEIIQVEERCILRIMNISSKGHDITNIKLVIIN